MVTSGITDTAEVRRSLKYYVDNFLCKDIGQKPHPHDRAFYPLKQDIMNHISMAKRALDLSTFDQENLRLKVEEWKKGNPTSSFYFRPFGKKTTTSESSDELEDEQTFLYIHQDEWQRELLTTYGNTITLMDATYKTTKYSIPLLFLCVKTNVNYTVVAEFVLQTENSDHIFEALSLGHLTGIQNTSLQITQMLKWVLSTSFSPKPNCTCVNSTGSRHGKGGLKIGSMVYVRYKQLPYWIFSEIVQMLQ